MTPLSRFADLPDYPFPRLRALLGQRFGDPLPEDAIDFSIGAPQDPPPALLGEALAAASADDPLSYAGYPPNEGTPDFRAAAAGWLSRRFGLDLGLFDPEAQIVPVNGTREALFMAAQLAGTSEARGADDPPLVLLPNPFYQCYAAAARAAGMAPHYVDASRATGFLPDFSALPEENLARARALYLCSPSNPEGAVADAAYWARLFDLAEAHDLLLFVDECYAEVYDGEPPLGALAAAAGRPAAIERLLTFHSLSKRSAAPGLRSGFVAGGADLVAAVRRLRAYGGAPLSRPVLAASAALWADDAHVAALRVRHRERLDIAEELLAGRFGFQRPAGGFFLWLEVGEGEKASLTLWRQGRVKVLPGAYLARPGPGGNPGARYIRVALVADPARTREGLARLVEVLG